MYEGFMSFDNQKPSHRQRAGGCLLIMGIVWLCGCGEFFAHKSTEIQTKEIFRNLSQISTAADVNRALPDIYTAEPKVIVAEDGVKLFYFTRHHTPAKLAGLIKEQTGCFVSENASTNQLVIKCANEQQADGVLEFLRHVDVAPIQVKIDCLISEIFADLTMDYETTTDIRNLLGEDITFESLMPGASMREPGRKGIGLQAGISKDKFEAVIDVLESRGYAKILMHPTVEVLNGTTARIETKERVPIQEKIVSEGSVIETVIYHDVVDYLDVTPQVYSDGTVGLKTAAGISSRTIPEGVTQAPIITSREIRNEENRLRKGQSLIIGGIVKTERVSVIRGVPFLKDIPGLGIIFSSKDFEERAKEILFILTPSISTQGTAPAPIIEDVKRKHARPEYKGGVKKVPPGSPGARASSERIERASNKKGAETNRIEAPQEQAQIGKILDEMEKLLEASGTKITGAGVEKEQAER
jgi:type II secretory pathway component GspD/PulD (secretin)